MVHSSTWKTIGSAFCIHSGLCDSVFILSFITYEINDSIRWISIEMIILKWVTAIMPSAIVFCTFNGWKTNIIISIYQAFLSQNSLGPHKFRW